jgi:hypothetical protein
LALTDLGDEELSVSVLFSESAMMLVAADPLASGGSRSITGLFPPGGLSSEAVSMPLCTRQLTMGLVEQHPAQSPMSFLIAVRAEAA